MTRKLVTVRTITNILPIENADAIELAVIDGWQVVTKKGEFQEGDPCVYFEIDSWLPADDSRYEFLKKSGVKVATDGKERIRLRTIKLRGQVSQGLALPLTKFSEIEDECEDIDSVLDVIKFERPEPKTADAAGNFPDCIPKTDEERIQNVYHKLVSEYSDKKFYPTLKLDGSSCTVAYFNEDRKDYWKDDSMEHIDLGMKMGEIAVCSRNIQLKKDENSHFYKAATKGGVIEMVKELGSQGYNYAIQGEVMGPGIQGNKEGFTDFQMFVFSIYDMEGNTYLPHSDVIRLCDSYGVGAAPALDLPHNPLQHSLQEILSMSDGPSINAKLREGVVWKSYDGKVSFKSISNKWLLKTGD